MTKKHFSRIAAFFTAAVLMTGSASINVNADEAMKIVVLGDSISTGYTMDSTLTGSYADMLGCYYNADVTSFAQDGFTSGDLLAQLSDSAVLSAVAEADVVLVTIGGNDILQPVLKNDIIDASQYSTMIDLIRSLGGGSDMTLVTSMNIYLNKNMPTAINQFRQNIVQIADILKSSANGEIVFQTVYNPMDVDADNTPLATSGSMEMLSSYVNKFLEGIPNNTVYVEGQCVNGAIRDLTDVTVIDTYDLLFDHGYYYTRIYNVDIHPNNRGHLIMAEAIIRALNLPETGSENAHAMRAAYTYTESTDKTTANATLGNVNADFNATIVDRILNKNYVYGDVDANGLVDIADAAAALNIYSSVAANVTPNVAEINIASADGNRDGVTDIVDASSMLLYYASRAAGIYTGTYDEFVMR